jgi:uncharacterized membrane protein
MPDVPVQVVLAAFNDPTGASAALGQLKKAAGENLIKIDDAAVLVKDSEGKVRIKETADMGGGKGAVIGGVVGGVVGLLAGPVGWAALGGSVVGGLAAKMRDGGFDDTRLKTVAEGLTPNSSAIIAVLEHKWVGELEKELRRAGADMVTEGIRDDISQALQHGSDVIYSVAADGESVVAARATTESS